MPSVTDQRSVFHDDSPFAVERPTQITDDVVVGEPGAAEQLRMSYDLIADLFAESHAGTLERVLEQGFQENRILVQLPLCDDIHIIIDGNVTMGHQIRRRQCAATFIHLVLIPDIVLIGQKYDIPPRFRNRKEKTCLHFHYHGLLPRSDPGVVEVEYPDSRIVIRPDDIQRIVRRTAVGYDDLVLLAQLRQNRIQLGSYILSAIISGDANIAYFTPFSHRVQPGNSEHIEI